MDITKNLNGLASHFINRDKQIFEAIAKEYDLEVDDVRKTAYTAIDKAPTKAIKSMAKAPKNVLGEPNRKKSGYNLFCKEIRPSVIKMLLEDESSRTFEKGGVEIVISESDFEKGNPKLSHITQKAAHLWREMSAEEKAEYNDKAKNEPAQEKKKPAKKLTKKEQNAVEVIPKGTKKAAPKAKTLADKCVSKKASAKKIETSSSSSEEEIKPSKKKVNTSSASSSSSSLSSSSSSSSVSSSASSSSEEVVKKGKGRANK